MCVCVLLCVCVMAVYDAPFHRTRTVPCCSLCVFACPAPPAYTPSRCFFARLRHAGPRWKLGQGTIRKEKMSERNRVSFRLQDTTHQLLSSHKEYFSTCTGFSYLYALHWLVQGAVAAALLFNLAAPVAPAFADTAVNPYAKVTCCDTFTRSHRKKSHERN